MAYTRFDIRREIRSKIQTWADDNTTLNGAINASVTAATLTSYVGYQDRGLIEWLDAVTDSRGETEISQIRTFTAATAAIGYIVRGARGSTAQSHSNGAACQLLPFWGWTDQEINRVITKGIHWLGDGMVYTLKTLSNTFKAGYKDFGAPTGAVYPTGDIVKRIDGLDTDGVYKPILGFRHLNDRIIFNANLLSDLTVRIYVQTRQVALTDDTTVIDQDKAAEVIELYAAGRLLEELLGNRSRYYDYSASLNDRASTLDELQRTAYYYKNQADILRDQISRPGLSGYAPIQKG